MNNEIERNRIEQRLALSDDEIDLIWFLPYLPEKERVREAVRAQLDKALEFFIKPAQDVTTDSEVYASEPANS